MRGTPEADCFITEQNGEFETTNRKHTGALGGGGLLGFTRRSMVEPVLLEKLWRVNLGEEWRDKMDSIRKEILGKWQSGTKRNS